MEKKGEKRRSLNEQVRIIKVLKILYTFFGFHLKHSLLLSIERVTNTVCSCDNLIQLQVINRFMQGKDKEWIFRTSQRIIHPVIHSPNNLTTFWCVFAYLKRFFNRVKIVSCIWMAMEWRVQHNEIKNCVLRLFGFCERMNMRMVVVLCITLYETATAR